MRKGIRGVALFSCMELALVGCGTTVSAADGIKKQVQRFPSVLNEPRAHFMPTSVHFVDVEHGILTGSLTKNNKKTGIALATADGGSHWHEMFTGGAVVNGSTEIRGDQMWLFVGAKDVYGSPVTTYYSANRGKTFTLLKPAKVKGFTMLPSGFGWNVSPIRADLKMNSIRVTHDDGRTWQTFRTPSSTHYGWIASASFTNPKTCYLLLASEPGAGQQQKAVMMTANGGTTWRILAGVNGKGLGWAGYANGIQFVTNKVGWLWENRGGLLETTDGGVTWQSNAVTHPESFEAEDVSFPTVSRGFAIFHDELNQRMVFESTANGGATWKVLGDWK